MIPDSAVCEWKNLGFELEITNAKLTKIEKDVTPEDVVVSTQDMLQKWQKKSGKASELIEALVHCHLNADAARFKKGLFIFKI